MRDTVRSTKLLPTLGLSVLSFIAVTALAACDGGGGLVGEAEKHAEAACACEDADCAKKSVAELNKIAVQRSEEVDALSEEDKKKWSAANDKASDCRDALK